MTVAELGERALLARIQARLTAAGCQRTDLVVGIGDDAAVVRPARGALTVLTTDAQVEGVHFDRRYVSPPDAGYRALAVNLSDLAAMGAVPRWALLSLALPDTTPVAEIEGFVAGVCELASAHAVAVVGGNLTRIAGPLVIDITAVGDVRPRRILTRGGARPGDELWVSGSLGAAAAGLEMLKAGETAAAECVARYRRPEPRVRLGRVVAQAKAARAAMDLSDGLADAARQLAEASECGVEIDAGALPIDRGARTWWEQAGHDPVVRALEGGDDYELLLAVPRTWGGRLRHARMRVAEPPLARIGVLTPDRATYVLRRGSRREPLPGGYRHW